MTEDNNIPTIEVMKKKALKIAEGIPNLKEKQKFMAEIRGITIEFSIIIEMCFNNLISATGKEMIFDHPNKELYLIKGIRTKKDMPKFRTKSRDMIKLIEETFPNLDGEAKTNLSTNLERFEALRDIFAHVPINWEVRDLEFISDIPYKHFFKDQTWKNVLYAHKEFVGLFQWIIDVILGYNRSILLKKELLSQIFLGKSQAEIQAEVKMNKKGENEN